MLAPALQHIASSNFYCLTELLSYAWKREIVLLVDMFYS